MYTLLTLCVCIIAVTYAQYVDPLIDPNCPFSHGSRGGIRQPLLGDPQINMRQFRDNFRPAFQGAMEGRMFRVKRSTYGRQGRISGLIDTMRRRRGQTGVGSRFGNRNGNRFGNRFGSRNGNRIGGRFDMNRDRHFGERRFDNFGMPSRFGDSFDRRNHRGSDMRRGPIGGRRSTY